MYHVADLGYLEVLVLQFYHMISYENFQNIVKVQKIITHQFHVDKQTWQWFMCLSIYGILFDGLSKQFLHITNGKDFTRSWHERMS